MKISNGVKKIFLIIFLGSLFFPLTSLAVNSYEVDGKTIYYKGLVPCGGLRTDSEGNPYEEQPIPLDGKIPSGFVPISETRMAKATPNCQLCHFFVMVDGIIDYLLKYIVPSLAILIIAIGGGMYFFAAGNPEMISRAKSLFTAVVIGLFIIYGAWLLVNLFFMTIGVAEWTGLKEGWWQIECEIKPTTTLPRTPTPTTPAAATTPAPAPQPGGKIIYARSWRGTSITTSNELFVEVRCQNDGGAEGEYKIHLLAANNDLVDTEPDIGWSNISAGGTLIKTVSTDWDRAWSIDNLGDRYTVQCEEQHRGVMDSVTKDWLQEQFPGIKIPEEPPKLPQLPENPLCDKCNEIIGGCSKEFCNKIRGSPKCKYIEVVGKVGFPTGLCFSPNDCTICGTISRECTEKECQQIGEQCQFVIDKLTLKGSCERK